MARMHYVKAAQPTGGFEVDDGSGETWRRVTREKAEALAASLREKYPDAPVTVKEVAPRRRACRRCGHEIQVGEAFKYFSKRYGGTTFYCAAHSPRPSEMTSGKTAQLLAIGEALEDAVADAETPEDVKTALEQARDDAESLKDEYEESATNIVDGFGHETYQSEELAEKASEIETWMDELESAISQVDVDELEQDEGESDEDFEQRKSDALDEARSAAEDAQSSMPG